MKNRVPRRRVVWLVLLPAAAVAAVALAATSNAAPKETPLHGKMRNIVQNRSCSASPVGVCSTFEATGDINGDGFVVVDTFPDPTNFGYSKAHTVVHTRKGDLTCHEAALFDLPGADHAFVDLCLIDGGTGDYAGATGYIQEVGTFDFANNVGQLDYYGKLVRAAD